MELGGSSESVNVSASLATAESAFVSAAITERLGTKVESNDGELGMSGIVKETGKRLPLRLT